MTDTNKLEVWMRGPVDGIAPMLQPVAQALLQASEEVSTMLVQFPDDQLWVKPGGLASVAFHLRHMKGVLDRLFSYARSQSLDEIQLSYLANEGVPDTFVKLVDLTDGFKNQVAISIEYLKTIHENQLLEPRGIGRKQIPSNVIGLLFHAAEHTQRHLGQLLVTAKMVSQ